MKSTPLILLLAVPLLLSACGKDDSADKAAESTAATQQTGSQTTELSPAEQARQALDQAEAGYKAFAAENRTFVWRDTELHITKARQALENGEFDLASQEAGIIAKQVELMKAQAAFAKKNWRKFMVNP